MARSLIVTSNFPPVRGGSATVYYNLALYCDGCIEVLAPERDWRNGEPLAGIVTSDAEAPFRIWRIPFVRRPAVGSTPFFRRASVTKILDILHVLRSFLCIRNICRTSKIEAICIGELIYGGWLVWPCRYLLRKKVVIYVHGEEITKINDNYLSNHWKSWFLRHADAIIVVSTFTRDAVITMFRIDLSKVFLIQNGVDHLQFFVCPQKNAGLAARLGLDGKVVLLTLGRLVERKGIDKMLRALPEIQRHVPNIHYVIVGEGPYRLELERLVADLDLAETATLVGDIDDSDRIDYYNLAHLFVMPNRMLDDGDTEGFGLVFLEANACGKPVIGGKDGGVPDAVRDGVSGLLVDGTDVTEIAAATIRLCTDRDLYQSLCRGAVDRAATAGWDIQVNSYQRLVNQLCRSDRRDNTLTG